MVDEVKELHSLIDELRKTAESKNAESAEAKEKIENIEKRIFEVEQINQTLVADLSKAKQAEEDMKGNYKNLERQLYMIPNSISKNEKSAGMKVLEKYIRNGVKILDAEEMKYLRTDNNPAGGYLAPPEYLKEILKDITEISPIRQVSRVRVTSTPKLEIPTRTGLVTSYYGGEGSTTPESQSTYGLENLKLHRHSAVTIISQEELNMAAFDMENEINSDVVESYAKVEGSKFVNGTGVEQPEGFMVNSKITSINSGAASDITPDSLIQLIGEIKSGYNPIWAFNRRTFSRILRLKDGAGQYLWTVGNIEARIPNMVLGFPYISAIDMPDIGANTYPVIFGDFAKGYLIGDHRAFAIIRDDTTLAGDGKVRFIFHRWNGGQVVKPEAFKKLKCST